jgi:hypothetical protein
MHGFPLPVDDRDIGAFREHGQNGQVKASISLFWMAELIPI